MGLEEDRFRYGRGDAPPKTTHTTIVCADAAAPRLNDMDPAKFKVFLKEFLPAVERKTNELQLVFLSDEIDRF